ncbi:hypothetical protein [Parasitella parasitica]|uniref:CCHC-type domain-containing protein n=1 Tax=Parasitella parasitica TaxID=35722 RepID=A0A0B7NDI6_9FUNG|nr:hypothetical protein [Parasitella parasitica]
MTNISDHPGETWATVVSRHEQKRAIQLNQRNMASNTPIPLIGSIIYEDDDLKAQLMTNRAMAIIQQSLSTDSVLFSFQKVSSDVEFRPLSLYDDRADGSLLIEAKFSDIDNASQTIQEGVSIQGVVYKALSTKERAKLGELMHVQFTLLHMVDPTTLIHDLMESQSCYSRVLQVKQYRRYGFFEGQMSMIIDTSVGYQVGQGKWQEAKSLSRMLYLSKFDCFVPATYKGAPPICHFCHQSGHIRSGCPQLVKRRCFGCDQPGHIVRFCPEAKQTVVLDLEEVDELTETEAVGQEETVQEIPSGSESEQEQWEENPLDEVLNSGEVMAFENNDE